MSSDFQLAIKNVWGETTTYHREVVVLYDPQKRLELHLYFLIVGVKGLSELYIQDDLFNVKHFLF